MLTISQNHWRPQNSRSDNRNSWKKTRGRVVVCNTKNWIVSGKSVLDDRGEIGNLHLPLGSFKPHDFGDSEIDALEVLVENEKRMALV